MKSIFQIGAVAMSVWMTVSAAAESLKVVDRRKDTAAEGQYIVFVSRPANAGDTIGEALVALATGKSAEALTMSLVVGLRMVEGKPAFGSAAEADVTALRSREGTPDVTTLIVRIDKDQAKVARDVLDRFAKRELGEENPAVVLLDMSRDTVTAVGLKQPYISGLSGPNVQQYYGDLSTLNRN